MSSLKMYHLNPAAKGLTLPEGFELTRFQSEADIEDWVWICGDGLIDPVTGVERFHNEITNADGPDAYRDTYFVEHEGKKIATFTVVPNMWSTGMGYIHMVACRHEYRGLGIGSFMSDYAMQKLVELGKERVFLLTGDARIPALATYLKAGFLPVNYIDDEGKDMVERWQKIADTLGIEDLQLLNNDGTPMQILHGKKA